MALETNAELLGRVPIFQGLSPAQLDMIVGSCREVYFDPGTPLLVAGETGRAAFLILSGSALPALPEGQMHLSELLGYGTLLGELAMLVETTFTLTIIARWPVRALALERRTMYAIMESDPAIARHFSAILVERLCQLAEELREVDGYFAEIETSLENAAAWAHP
jgi:CRP-like cAMP-binding protein